MELTSNRDMVSEVLEEDGLSSSRAVPFAGRQAGPYMDSDALTKKELIDIGLRTAFGGYWKLFMDGNLSDIGSFRVAISCQSTKANVPASHNPT